MNSDLRGIEDAIAGSGIVPKDDYLRWHSGFDAGYTLAAWLKHLGRIPNAVDVIPRVSRRLEDLYRAADSDGRNRIETGVLEHVIEAPGLRRHFEHWGQDPVLREAHEPALEWGLAHEDRDV